MNLPPLDFLLFLLIVVLPFFFGWFWAWLAIRSLRYMQKLEKPWERSFMRLLAYCCMAISALSCLCFFWLVNLKLADLGLIDTEWIYSFRTVGLPAMVLLFFFLWASESRFFSWLEQPHRRHKG